MHNFKDLRKLASQELEALSDSPTHSTLNTQQLIYDLEVHQIELKMQNEELQIAQHEVETIRNKYLALFEFAPVGYLKLQEDGVILTANLKAAQLLGIDRAHLLGMQIQAFIVPEDQDLFYFHLKQIRINKQPLEEELKMRRKDGTSFFARIDSILLEAQQWNLTLIDISLQKQTEQDLRESQQKLEQSLQDKEILLQEIHHRVKNNLQMIISLLRIQARSLKDSIIVKELKEFEKRVRVISDLHEILYQSQDFSRISPLPFFKKLTHNLGLIYPDKKVKIQLDISVENISLELAMYCGMIVNELISNALKHAFPPTWKGKPTINIKFDSVDEEHYVLWVTDNGIGLPFPMAENSLGLHLVELFSKKIKGQKTVETTQGTSFQIRFQKEHPN